MVNIRRAKVDEYEILTDIAIKSEAYWGYDSDYMNKFKSIYNVSEEFIKNNPTVLIEEDNSIIGFYGLICKDNETSLECFFIEPKYIGKEFYVKMGAIPCGEVESLLKKGRIIPQLIYTVEK